MIPGPKQKKKAVMKNVGIPVELFTTKLSNKETNDRKYVMDDGDDAVIMNGSPHVTESAEEETSAQRQLVVTTGLGDEVENSSMARNRRVVESMIEEPNRIHQNIINSVKHEWDPVVGYAQEPLMSLSKACVPLASIIDNISSYVQMALDNTPVIPLDGLTVDESAAIRLYTMEWDGSGRSLYSMLNRALKNNDRKYLQPYSKYMKLFITALVKLPCLPQLTIWRGVTKNVSEEFPSGTLVTWWAFSSCTTGLPVLQNNLYLGDSGNRTLFSIEAINCRSIRGHSHFPKEDEVLLLPGTQMIVKSQFTPAADLYVIHVKQIVPATMLLEPPYEGANVYPLKQAPWYRKKRFIIPMCVLAILIIGAIIVGVILSTRSNNNNGTDLPIVWKDGLWAFSCDFNGSSFTSVSTLSTRCGPKCYETPLCTHYTWVDSNNGTCFMKQGDVSKGDAFRTNDPTMLCGVVYLSDYAILNRSVYWEGNDWAYACEFSGHDLSNVLSTAADCGPKCTATPMCTHFTWSKYDGGTCFMKQDNISKDDAVSVNNPYMICGVVYGSDNIRSNGTVEWDTSGKWAYACDFEGNDLSSMSSTAADCGPKCYTTPMCTHFTWSNFDGGTCFMKHGSVSKQDAFQTDDPSMVCGIAGSA